METSAADEESRKRKHSDDDQYSKLLDIILSFNQVLGLPPLGQSKEKHMSTKGRKLRHIRIILPLIKNYLVSNQELFCLKRQNYENTRSSATRKILSKHSLSQNL